MKDRKTKVKVIRSDNAMDLGKGIVASMFLNSQIILDQTSCVAIPQQNRIIKRKHRHLLEVASALLFHSKSLISYCGERILATTFLINRFPSKVLKWKIPYELLFWSSSFLSPSKMLWLPMLCHYSLSS